MSVQSLRPAPEPSIVSSNCIMEQTGCNYSIISRIGQYLTYIPQISQKNRGLTGRGLCPRRHGARPFRHRAACATVPPS